MTDIYRERRRGRVSWVSLGLLERSGLPHGFTFRRGGASRGKFSSLNFTTRQGDLPERVEENWRRLEAAAGIPGRSWVLLSQVHGSEVVRVRAGGAPSHHRLDCPPADALVTDRPGVTLGILTADCLPVVLALPGGAGAAAVHAGWKGSLEGVVVEAVKALAAAAGADPSVMTAGLGPCIGRCCYQVGEEVHSRFVRKWGRPFSRKVFASADPWRLDLQEANRLQLLEAGLDSRKIGAVPLCTSCRRDLFFSHRRDGERTGRMLAFASLPRGGRS